MRRNDFNNDDNDDFDEEDSLLGTDERQGEEVKPWDSFKIIHRKPEVGSTVESAFIDNGVKVLKVVTIIFVFLVVLGTAVVSKLSLFLMTSQIKKNVTRAYCNEALDPSRQYIFSMPEVERTTWIWLVMLAYFVPEAGTFIRSVRIMLFKSWKYPLFSDFLSILITESLPAIGSSLLVFNILPEMDVIKGAMLTNAMCFVPGIFLIVKNLRSWKKGYFYRTALDVFAVAAQTTAFVAWPLVEDKAVLWLIPLSVVLISFGWWENFLPENSPIEFWRKLAKSKAEFPNSKYVSYSITSVLKCLLFFTTAVASFVIREGDASFLFKNFGDAFSDHNMTITEVVPQVSGSNINIDDAISTGITHSIESSITTQLIVWGINILCTYVCYAFGKFACKIMIQGASFALPLGLTVPVLISALVIMCGYFAKDECAYYGEIPEYLFFNTPPLVYLEDIVGRQYAWVWLLWLLSQIWITQHIWRNKNSKLSPTESLFMRPMYDAFLIDQSIAMNRRNVVDQLMKTDGAGVNDFDGDIFENSKVDEDKITRIYACATMWHETPEEMMEFLKSILRLDEDQAAHRIVRQHMQYPDEAYYEFETHIFFDDAFLRKSADDNDPNLNSYVQDLIGIIGQAASEVHKTTVRIRPPIIYPTPYGGRLVWTLPGKTKMICHLKDKAKIRAKKRWSQVMYMYYLLGFKIMDNDEFTQERVKIRSKNTYLLALDGDIDFQPEAVHLLVQYMKKKDNIGACCGRIHPVGSGAMSWYQVFEYAVGHWMQKATEHVIGCVLCSPGCFSLFRASALMDHNVMARYTTRSNEARHYVQYDQGEDRWLCTLLLQRGYRVEYSAASDAYTHCPEGFNEFYNQRRRWMPSTTANILDLLQDAKHIKEVNDDISTPYIWYQIILMISTAIGPGTIYLMLVGAFVTAFKLSQWAAFWYNIVPIFIFVMTCIMCKSDTQLTVAGAISAFYGLVMMAVLIGVVMQIHEDGILAPSSLFFFLMMGEYVVAALVHPKEFYCLKYGVIYLVTVPSMYMLLVIYSVFNMNNVSWGTREVTIVPKTAENAGEQKKVEKKQSSMIVEWLYGVRDFFASCTKDSGHLLMISNSLAHIQEKIDQIEHKVEDIERLALDPESGEKRKTTTKSRTTIIEGSRASRLSIRPRPSSAPRKSTAVDTGGFQDIPIEEDEDFDDDSDGTPSDDLQTNSWFYEGELIRGHVTYLDKKEEHFWKDLLDKYLHPIEDDKDKVAKDLKDLRDKMVMTFFALNTLFVLVVFLMTLQKDILHLDWPFNPKINFTYTGTTNQNEIVVTKTYLALEPIGFVFLIFFFLLMGIQFIGMIIHRFGTYSQIMANTDLDFDLFETKLEDLTEDELIERDPIKIFKKLIKLKGVNGDEREDEENTHVSRRNTVAVLAQNKDKKRAVINDLDAAFAIRMQKIRNGETADIPLPRKTMDAINRRATVVKRKSQMTVPFNYNAYKNNFNLNREDSRPAEHQFDNLGFEHDTSEINV